MNPKIILHSPADQAEISFLTRIQKDFLVDPYRFTPHDPELEPRKEDLSIPKTVSFRWEGGAPEAELQISPSPDFADCISFSGNGSAEVSNLFHGKKYFWRVKCEGGISEVRSFTVAPDLPRWIWMPDVSNVRDLGGWKNRAGQTIRQGMIYRGAQLAAWNHLKTGSAINAEGRDVFFHALKIHTELDLRGGGTCCLPVARYELIPVVAYATWSTDGIFSEAQMNQVRQIFELFADPEAYPLYFHCQGGGDRTGTIAFLLENVLGLDEETILTEYELSNLSVSGERTRFSEVWCKFMEKLESFAPGESRGRQVGEYLRQCGVSEEVKEKIRSILLV